jgi:hypothetical protein
LQADAEVLNVAAAARRRLDAALGPVTPAKWSDKDIEEVRNALLSQQRIAYEIGSTTERGRIGQHYRILE